jgi:hypothetical protein
MYPAWQPEQQQAQLRVWPAELPVPERVLE